MSKSGLKSLAAALIIATSCQGAFAAGPVTPLSAPSAVVQVKNNRNAAAAVGAVAGAAILLGILGAANADAEPSREEYYVERDDYDRRPIYDGGDDSDYYSFVSRNPGSAAEACRRGILKAARQYGASDAVVNSFSTLRYVGDATVRFRATITVFYPEASRRSSVSCTVQEGYLLSARALR
jgi:hypothetical protein